jgi:hypothetical protein
MHLRLPPHAGIGLAIAVLALLAGCAPAAVVPPPSPGPSPSPLACLDQLTQRGVAYQALATHAAIRGCNISGGVRVEGLLAPFDKPAEMTCDMALRLDEFEINVVQVAAQRYFKRRVTLVHHFGAYSCRNVNGTRRLSEHAHGQAIDIAGFDLDGGMKISVKEHWRGAGARSAFLHEVAQGACRYFNVVLTPNSNADHRNHLHLDLGPYPLCEA